MPVQNLSKNKITQSRSKTLYYPKYDADGNGGRVSQLFSGNLQNFRRIPMSVERKYLFSRRRGRAASGRNSGPPEELTDGPSAIIYYCITDEYLVRD